MVDTVTIGFFLEDIGQENFIKSLVIRIAEEARFDAGRLTFDVRSASGGSSVAITRFKQFLRECAAVSAAHFDVLIVCIDGDRKGATEVTRQLKEFAERSVYGGIIIYAIPEPHIEKWYLADLSACQQAIGALEQPKCPPLKSEKDRYKRALIDAIRGAGVTPLQGGAEYGAEIAAKMNLYDAGKNDDSLGRFIGDMKTALLAFRS